MNGSTLFAGTDGGGVWIRPLSEIVTAVEDDFSQAPVSFALEQNYPNPFNPGTTIGFSLTKAVQVQLTVYDINGRKVSDLVSGSLSPGAYDIQWDATSNNGTQVAGGIYIYRLQAGSFIQMRKMTLLR